MADAIRRHGTESTIAIMHILLTYIDTSVVGGCEDDEFREPSREFFSQVREGSLRMMVSDLLFLELMGAPQAVKEHLPEAGHAGVIRRTLSDEAKELAEAYLAAGVVGPASRNDALHVAIATVEGADVVVSWNFKHIVHMDKVRAFGAVNLRLGYRVMDIRSPLEII